MQWNADDVADIRTDRIQTGNRGGGSGGTDGRDRTISEEVKTTSTGTSGKSTTAIASWGVAGSAAIQLPDDFPWQLLANRPTTQITSGLDFVQQLFAPGFAQHDSTGASRTVFFGWEQQQVDDCRSASVRQPQAPPPQRERCAAEGTTAGKPTSETTWAQASRTATRERYESHEWRGRPIGCAAGTGCASGASYGRRTRIK